MLTTTEPEEVKAEEMQPEMQPKPPVSDVKPKRFAFRPSKRSASETKQMMLPDPKLEMAELTGYQLYDFARQPETKSSDEVSSIVK